MALSQFKCPHCRSAFQVDTSLPSLHVACPHCRQPVALLSEPPVVEPPLSAPPVMEPPLAPGISEPPARDPRGYSPADLLPPAANVSPPAPAHHEAQEHETIANDFRSRQIAVDDRASRKFVKNMIVGVVCAIVLLSILAYFVMRAGS